MKTRTFLERIEVFPIEELGVDKGAKLPYVSELNIKMARSLVAAFKAFTFSGDTERATMRATRVLAQIDEIKPSFECFSGMRDAERLKVIRAFAELQARVLAELKPKFMALLKREN